MYKKEQDILENLIYIVKNNGVLPVGLEKEASILKSLTKLPKKQIPSGVMQRKYIHAHNFAHKPQFGLFKVLAASISSFAIMAGIAFAGVLSANSLPGEKLFTLKKAAEQTRIKLSFNEVEQANLQIALSEKRLEEVKNAVANRPELEIAALNELAEQNETAIESIKKATVIKSIQKEDHPLVASLDSLTKKQELLAKQIKNSTEVKNLALSNLEKSQQSSNEIKDLIKVAENSNEQASKAQIENDKNIVSVLGQITKISSTSLTVENTTFIITEKTVINDQNGTQINVIDLKEKMKVSVTGSKNQELTATKILLFPTPTKVNSVKPTEEQSSENTTNNSNIATGYFIVEDPNNPQ